MTSWCSCSSSTVASHRCRLEAVFNIICTISPVSMLGFRTVCGWIIFHNFRFFEVGSPYLYGNSWIHLSNYLAPQYILFSLQGSYHIAKITIQNVINRTRSWYDIVWPDGKHCCSNRCRQDSYTRTDLLCPISLVCINLCFADQN